MPIKFLAQPFDLSGQAGSALVEALKDSRFSHLYVATAWVKYSGLSRISSALRAFTARGGESELIVGIDEGGASREGLQLALDLFTRVIVFHDPGNRTFHPKVYVAQGTNEARLLVGSSNVTKGGLFTNYEASVVCDLDRTIEDDESVLRDVHGFFESLRGGGDAAQELDSDFLEKIASDPRYRVGSEAAQNKARGKARAAAKTSEAGANAFGPSIAGLAQAPAPDTTVLDTDDADEDAPLVADSPDPTLDPEGDEEQKVEAGATGFWKVLSNSDASATSSPGQIIIPIRFADFFPPLTLQKDEQAGGGVRQSHAEFEVTFVDGTFSKLVDTARVILYEPASWHPRPNNEMRFTFRDGEVFTRLSAGDILVFSHGSNGGIQVQRRPAGSMGAGRYGGL